MPVLPFSEDSIQETCSAEKANVARMQRCDRSLACNLISGHQEGLCLLPCRRARQQVLDRIVRKATINQRCSRGGWNGICHLRSLQLGHVRTIDQPMQQRAVPLIVLTAHALSDTYQPNLIEALRLWIG